jgi:hypothetical protein|tara:strand:- start:266 stop:544 length:279 start_codon:yes stop_codon:yes gene_type:complete
MKYRKKPVVIEAIQWEGNVSQELSNWVQAYRKEHGSKYLPESDWIRLDGQNLIILTLDREHTTQVGDWIIRGIQGELYPCKPDIFDATYEAV